MFEIFHFFFSNRAKEKERTRQKRIAAKINNIQLGPSRKELKNAKMATSSCKVSVVIDMSFDDLMDARVSLIKTILWYL
jgi:tRNA (guanine9-N1)-methyltransferase